MAEDVAEDAVILIIESDAEARRRAAEALLPLAGRMLTAADAESAVRTIRRQRPDLVLLALDLPGVDGIDLGEELRRAADDGDLQIVGTSESSDSAIVARALDAGMTAVLERPVDPVILVARARSALRTRSRLAQLRPTVAVTPLAGESTVAERQRKVGPYRVLQPLGQGGMGDVHRAIDERLNREVAVKRVRNPQTRAGKERQRLLREARAVARLNHPTIVALYDLVELEDEDWLVMELVDGQALTQVLKGRGALAPREALGLGAEIASALDAAHQQGILHRDLKPDNVMIAADGRARLLDFGLARAVEQESETLLTEEGKILGTPSAMSPEQARGQDLDARSELFSLGSLLYTMLSGRNPFAARDIVETLKRVCLTQPKPLHEVAPEVPVEVSRYVDRLLQKRPEDRPASAREVQEVLERLARGESIESSPARTPGRFSLLRRWIRSRG